MATQAKTDTPRGGLRQSIQGRLILLLLVLLVPILFIQVYNYRERYENRRAEELQANLEIARSVANTFEAFVMDIVHTELAIGQAMIIPELSDAERNKLLHEFMSDNPSVRVAFWMSPDGMIIAAGLPEYIGWYLSDRSFYTEVVAGKPWHMSELIMGRQSNRPAFTIGRGIRNAQGELLGVVGVGIDPDRLSTVIRFKREEDAGISIVDNKGMLAYRYPQADYSWEERNWLSEYPIIKEALGSKEVVAKHISKYFRVSRLIAFTPIPSIGWVAGAGREESRVMSAVHASLLPQAIMFLLIMSAAFGTALIYSRKIAFSIKTLRNNALAIGKGESPMPVTVSGGTELDELAQAFGKMAEDLELRDKERRRAEEALRGSELRLRRFYESGLLGMIFWNMDGTITDANDTFLEMVGYGREDLTANRIDWIAMTPPEFRHLDEVSMGELKAAGVNSAPLEKEFIRKDGSRIPVLVAGAMLDEARRDGVAFVLDITTRKEAEETIRTTVRRFHTILSNIFSGILVLTEEGRVEYVNQNLCDQFGIGRGPAALLGLTTSEMLGIVSPAYHYPEAETARIQEIVARGERIEDEEIVMRNGRVFLRDYIPILVDGKPGGRMWQHRDITERKRMEEDLRKTRDELELRVEERTAEVVGANEILRNQADLLELAHDAIIVRDMEGAVTFWNNGARETYGLLREEVLGKAIHAMLKTKFPVPFEQLKEHIVRMRRWDGELTHRKPTGEDLIVESRWALQTGKDGMPIGVLEINRDITGRRLAEEALQANLARLELLNEELQEFAFIASHDLQEPLRKIQTFGNILVRKHKESLNDEGREHLGRMIKAANRMSDLLRALLYYSRTGSDELNLRSVSLGEVAKDVYSDMEVLIRKTRATVEINELPTILGDPSLVRQLFQNIIENALKYCKEFEPPVVKIYGSVSDDCCRVVFKDNGIGFEEEFTQNIFRPFERLHGKNSPYEGMGMGLAICKKIADRHGGRIEAGSIPGEGSTFIVTFPRGQERGPDERG